MRKLEGVRVVVVGMGLSGVGALRLLRQQCAEVRAVDAKPTGEIEGVTVEPQTEAAFRDAELVVISPGVPADLDLLAPVRARGVPVIGELELAAPFLKGPTIGITGTNGKTTTTALTGHILRESGIACQVGGNIGTAPAEMVESSRSDQWNVLELSSFQLETIETLRAPIAACLNLTQNHLDRHHSFENYVNAKARLFETQGADDLAVLNADDLVAVSFAQRTKAKTVWFSGTHQVSGAWLDGNVIKLQGQGLLDVQELRLRGRHNHENVMAAALMAEAGRRWAVTNLERRPPPSRRWSIAWNLCERSTAWLITTIRKRLVSTRRSRPSMRSAAEFGSSWAVRTKGATTPFFANPCARKPALRY